MLLASTNCVGAVWCVELFIINLLVVVVMELVSRHRIGYERQGCARAIDVVLHGGRPAQPDRPDNFSVHLNGKPSTPSRHARKRGDASQKRRVAFDKVEKVLRGDAEESCVRFVQRHLDAKYRGPIHPAECLDAAISTAISG